MVVPSNLFVRGVASCKFHWPHTTRLDICMICNKLVLGSAFKFFCSWCRLMQISLATHYTFRHLGVSPRVQPHTTSLYNYVIKQCPLFSLSLSFCAFASASTKTPTTSPNRFRNIHRSHSLPPTFFLALSCYLVSFLYCPLSLYKCAMYHSLDM